MFLFINCKGSIRYSFEKKLTSGLFVEPEPKIIKDILSDDSEITMCVFFATPTDEFSNYITIERTVEDSIIINTKIFSMLRRSSIPKIIIVLSNKISDHDLFIPHKLMLNLRNFKSKISFVIAPVSFGIGDSINIFSTNFIVATISKFHTFNNIPLQITPTTTKQFIHADDLCDAILKNVCDDKIYIINSTIKYNLLDIVKFINITNKKYTLNDSKTQQDLYMKPSGDYITKDIYLNILELINYFSVKL